MTIPFEPILFGVKLNIHLILEYTAFFVAFSFYKFQRKNVKDLISTKNRLSIILGAVIGAFLGSRIVGVLEFPFQEFSMNTLIYLLNTKTIMGGLFGGLLGVEFAKKVIKEKRSSGDLFTFPIILGIFIGRIGCFLYGVNEFTYGKTTNLFMGMDLGDGLMRHPIALYELFYLIVLVISLKKLKKAIILKEGDLFQYFMVFYFGFRFIIEFLKPNTFLVLGLSSIQILCLVCLIYYRKTILNLFNLKRK